MPPSLEYWKEFYRQSVDGLKEKKRPKKFEEDHSTGSDNWVGYQWSLNVDTNCRECSFRIWPGSGAVRNGPNEDTPWVHVGCVLDWAEFIGQPKSHGNAFMTQIRSKATREGKKSLKANPNEQLELFDA